MHSEHGNKSPCLNKNSETEHIGSKEQEATNSSFSYQSLQSVRKKLLDLSGRIQLLNYKHPKASCVRIIDELPNQIYEELKKGKSFSFIPVPDPSEEELIENGYLQEDDLGALIEVKPFPNAENWAKQLGLDVKYELPSDNGSSSEQRHYDTNIQTLMYSRELEARLRSIKGKSQTAVEESGSNVLYLVLGFLEWYESIESKVKRVAPLFTLPVQLERQKFDKEQGVYRYAISLKDEGILTNITLSEKLANDFNLALPLLDEDVNPEEYFESIRTVVA